MILTAADLHVFSQLQCLI